MSRCHTALLLAVAIAAGLVALSEPDQWLQAVGIRRAGSPNLSRQGRDVDSDLVPVVVGGSPDDPHPVVATVTPTASPAPDTTMTLATAASEQAQLHPLGKLAVFPGRLRALRGRPGVSVSVEMAGHMREYERCAYTLRQRVLSPLGAGLTVATYPSVGRKRYGVRRDDPSAASPHDAVTSSDLEHAYGSEHVVATLFAVQARVEATVRNALPFVDAHFRWAVLQVFMMEVAHNISAAVADGSCGVDGSSKQCSPDVTIRIRPDAFVVAELSFQRIPPLTPAAAAAAATGFEVRFHCNDTMLGRHHEGGAGRRANRSSVVEVSGGGPKETLTAIVLPGSLLQAPHHPQLRWFNDPLSDHSLIGHTADYGRFAGRMYSAMLGMPERRLNATYFLHGGTLERIWHRFAVEDANVSLTPCPGWHFLLRDPQAYRNSTLGGDEPSRHRRALVAAIFAITDPLAVGCPVPPNETTTSVAGSYGRARRKRR